MKTNYKAALYMMASYLISDNIFQKSVFYIGKYSSHRVTLMLLNVLLTIGIHMYTLHSTVTEITTNS